MTSSQAAPSTVEPVVATTATRTRLLYLRDTLMVCGPGKTILNTWRTIDRSTFALTIVATQPREGERNALLDAADRLGATTTPLAIGRGLDLVAVWRLAQLLKRHEIDVLQTHDSQTRRIGALAAFLVGTRHVTSVHGWIFNDRKELLARWLDQRLIRLAESVITVSERLKRDLEAAGVPADRITPLQNAILLDDYQEAGDAQALRQQLGLAAGQPVVAIIGRLSAEKGHSIFLDAARMVLQKVPDAKFLIVGDGPLRQSLEQETGAMGLASSVLFTGHLSDTAPIYAVTTVLAISSFTEGIPNVLLEAFAYGKPAVATSVGGVPEVLVDGVTGILVPPGEARPLAESLVRLLTDDALRAEMGRAAKERIGTQFNFEHRTRALERLYQAGRATGKSGGIRAMLGGAYRATQSRIDRALHSGRRRQARATLAAARPASALILCYGNICRSPYAAAVLKQRVPADFKIVSGGFIRPGRPSPEVAVAAAAGFGVDLSPHRSTVITEEMVRTSDLIVVMDTDQRQTIETRYGVERRRILVLGDLDPLEISTRTIPDPYARPLAVFQECYGRVDRCIRALAAAIGARP